MNKVVVYEPTVKREELFTPTAEVASEQVKDGRYNLNIFPLGRVIVLNMSELLMKDGTIEKRQGSEKDAKDLIKLFTSLGFVVEVHTNLKADEVKSLLNNPTFENCFGCLFFVVLAHGEKGMFLAYDFNEIKVSDVSKSGLPKIPKVLLFQKCRGSSAMPFHDKNDTRSNICCFFDPIWWRRIDNENKNSDKHVEIESEEFKNEEEPLVLPLDTICGYSTVIGYKSYRHTIRGSWYIEEFCKAVKENYKTKDIVQLLTKVNNALSERRVQNDGTSTVGDIKTNLLKDLYLYPLQTTQ